MGRFFLEFNITNLLGIFAVALAAAVGFTLWDSLFSSSQAEEIATYIQYEWQFNPSYNYGTTTFAPVALSNKAATRLASNIGQAGAVINTEWGQPIAFSGTSSGKAFTLTLPAVPVADCQDILSSEVLAPLATSIQVTGKTVETALPLGGDAAAADCAAGPTSVIITAKGHPGS
jgi:hypothetical protein